jgi:phosphatidate cytidylyltransferase
MLKTRIITAVLLLAVLLPVLFFNYFPAFGFVVTLFVGAAIWEAGRLFGLGATAARAAGLAAAVLFVALLNYQGQPGGARSLFAVAALLWLIRYAPSLGLGLPPLKGAANWALLVTFSFAVFACFFAIVELYRHSPLYLLSVMVLVWIADIGAYFSGKAFGKRKLAPTISPGKSWEGAIGGGIAVLVIASISIVLAGDANSGAAPWLQDTFAYKLQARFGWALTLLALLLVVAASVIGDLFESQLKRRAAMKDSSNLLPGHGGVLDRIDALIPVLPLAALIGAWL